MLAAKSAIGAEPTTNEQAQAASRGDYYRARELSVDAFGTASMDVRTLNHLTGNKVRHDTRMGAGAGANYFITRYIGIGADVYSEDTKGNFIDSAEANLILPSLFQEWTAKHLDLHRKHRAKPVRGRFDFSRPRCFRFAHCSQI